MPVSTQWIAQEFPTLANVTPLVVGGQKEVFGATHPSYGDVVLKIVDPRIDARRVDREAQAVVRVSSARVPAIHEDGSKTIGMAQVRWILERRIQGLSVRDCIAHGPLCPADIYRLSLHLLEVLRDAETVRIVHRDIKPDNLMRDDAGNFWVLDFGLARHLELASVTATGVMAGCTPGYAPREQTLGLKDDIDSRTDLFAAAVTIYECATGVNPFRVGASQLDFSRNAATNPLPDLPSEFDQEFRDLVSVMAQTRRHHRIESAAKACEWMTSIYQRLVS